MNMKLKLIIAMLATNVAGYCWLSGPASLVDLSKAADLVVIGTARNGNPVGQNLYFTVEISRVLKGEGAVPGTNITAFWAAGDAVPVYGSFVNSAVKPLGSGLWFLRRTDAGWTILPFQSGRISFGDTFISQPERALPDVYSYKVESLLSDKLANELAFAIESANGGCDSSLRTLHYGILDELASPAVRSLYARMSTASSVQQQIVGLSGLIRLGDADALNAVAQNDKEFHKHPLEVGVMLWSLRNQFRPVDGNQIAVLGRLSTTTEGLSPDFREAAAHALAAIHSKTALPFLATLLDDTNQNIRIEAVGGLASFANGLPMQTSSNVASLGYLQLPETAPYKTPQTLANLAIGKLAIAEKEDRYRAFWREWWVQNHVSLGF